VVAVVAWGVHGRAVRWRPDFDDLALFEHPTHHPFILGSRKKSKGRNYKYATKFFR
jgi:hypothetical protein